ncbi:hypothetical protein [Mucilaginibacter kameinonensis]|uniref:hypothetical protein n=1 Tax=Mucilaginibacter kameinonensis TaxID=452286 RepID=UPI000EF7DDAD|nr:hypothetical protein [Mucilaginibacter kameinonensis]
MSYFENNDYSEDERRFAAFTAAKAIRESVSLARRAQNPITYETALGFVQDVNPDAYAGIKDLLLGKNESEIVRLYKEKAAAMSDDFNEVKPIDLLDKEIAEIEPLSKNAQEKKSLKTYLINLKAAREYFAPVKLSEHKILNHDFYLADRSKIISDPGYSQDDYKDYRLDKTRLLRLRLLHPDKPEAILGTDLIYEQFDLLRERVRFVHLQYKMWDNDTIYFSKGSIKEQIEKLESKLCSTGFCCDQNGKGHGGGFRFPHCSAFFRPTEKLVAADSKLVSNGIHIPICTIKGIKDNDTKLSRKNTRESGVTSKIFEELFIGNFIGSRWMSLDELDAFYASNDIPNLTNSIRVHAQEVITATEEEMDKRNYII